MSIRISVVICTYNRVNYLRKAVQSLIEQSVDNTQYEILVLDNGSRDDTKHAILQEFGHVKNLRYIMEPILGLNHARNTGWRNARGEYVAYLDDDAIASSRWLEKILNVFETVKPRPGCVGGRIDPIWESPRPPWLSKGIAVYLAVFDWSTTPKFLNGIELLAGVNIAFPRQLLEATGGFHVNLDRRGRKLLSHGDILVQLQLMNKGYGCYYDPEISVQHHIQATRLRKRWLIRRLFWEGISEFRLRLLMEAFSHISARRIAIKRGRDLLLSPRRLLSLAIPTNDANVFDEKCRAWADLGYLMGSLGMGK